MEEWGEGGREGGETLFVYLFSHLFHFLYHFNPLYIQEFITQHMYNPFKYFFDRKIAIPQGMLNDCKPFPMPTRKYLDNPLTGQIYAPSKKRRVAALNPRERWRDHLAIAIGADLQGLSFHYHGAAWNTVIFGKKRWILYDPKRWSDNVDEPNLQRRLALEADEGWETILPTSEWIRQLYPDPWRQNEIRNWGMDCIQHAGMMMYVPKGWMHMVVNIGDTVSVISEVGLDMGTGKKPEDFLYDPHADSDDDNEGSDDGSEDDSEDRDGSRPRYSRRRSARQGGGGDPYFDDTSMDPPRPTALKRKFTTRRRGPPPPPSQQQRRPQEEDSSDDDDESEDDSEDDDDHDDSEDESEDEGVIRRPRKKITQ